MRDQFFAQKRLSGRFYLIMCPANLDAACFATGARMNLRLDDPNTSIDFPAETLADAAEKVVRARDEMVAKQG